MYHRRLRGAAHSAPGLAVSAPRTGVYRASCPGPGRELDSRSEITGRVSDNLLTVVKIQGKAMRHVTAAQRAGSSGRAAGPAAATAGPAAPAGPACSPR